MGDVCTLISYNEIEKQKLFMQKIGSTKAKSL